MQLKLQPERKQVSVLFVDLCDSTAHVAHSDPEEARAYLDDALRLMSGAVEAYGGTVSQLLGDGLLALFGAPVAQEDHALRACLTAISMHTAVRERASRADIKPYVLRIGIHSGEVIVGVAGHYLWSHYRADGCTIHLASRLEKLAEPGTVLLSAATQRLIAEQLDTKPLGAQSIRGLDVALNVFELVVGTEGSAAAPLTRRQRWAPLVGREEALTVLNSLAAATRTGTMRVVGLRGEAGIGKSRLIAEWCSGPELSGFGVCTSFARGYSSANAYGVIADLARSLVNLPGRSRLATHPAASEEMGADVMPQDPSCQHAAAINDLLDVKDTDKAWLTLSPAVRCGVGASLKPCTGWSRNASNRVRCCWCSKIFFWPIARVSGCLNRWCPDWKGCRS